MPNNTEHVDVNIKLFTFKPEVLEIPVGKTVVWTNGDAIEHSITQGTPDNPGPEFDSGFFTKGDTYSFTFTEVGEYDYFCKRHNSMRGRIKVTE
ncbi:MAG: plastocyanin/azurin family copper-binding protein [Deltaproteobacteria bacterium]